MAPNLCVISDTHDNISAVRKAVSIIRGLEPLLVIHCGDICAPETLDEFSGFPLRLVFGNCDQSRRALQKKAEQLGFGEVVDCLELDVSGFALFAYHGTESGLLREALRSQRFDFILHGHTHQRRDDFQGRTRIINPGALYRASQYTFAVIDLSTSLLRFVEVTK